MEEKQLVLYSLSDLPHAAKTILSDIGDERVFAVQGKMGAGKTTLIKAFCSELGVTDQVSSPTFALVNEYADDGNESIYHFDFYRINKVEEVFDIGYEEYLYSGNYCFMEWPELIVNMLPSHYVMVHIDVGEDECRTIRYAVQTD